MDLGTKMCHGEDAFWEWLEMADLVKFVDESPTVDGWVRLHSHDFLESSNMSGAAAG